MDCRAQVRALSSVYTILVNAGSGESLRYAEGATLNELWLVMWTRVCIHDMQLGGWGEWNQDLRH